MNRRGFLRAMVGGVAVAAAERTFPFRVFSFPKEVVPNTATGYSLLTSHITPELLRSTIEQMKLRLGGPLPSNFYWDCHPKQLEAYVELTPVSWSKDIDWSV